MPKFNVVVDLYYRPNVELKDDATLALALETALWAREQYPPQEKYAGLSHQIYLNYTDDDGNVTVLRRWKWTISKGQGYWKLLEIRGIPDDE